MQDVNSINAFLKGITEPDEEQHDQQNHLSQLLPHLETDRSQLISQLAEKSGLDIQTLTKTITTMQNLGLVTISNSGREALSPNAALRLTVTGEKVTESFKRSSDLS